MTGFTRSSSVCWLVSLCFLTSLVAQAGPNLDPKWITPFLKLDKLYRALRKIESDLEKSRHLDDTKEPEEARETGDAIEKITEELRRTTRSVNELRMEVITGKATLKNDEIARLRAARDEAKAHSRIVRTLSDELLKLGVRAQFLPGGSSVASLALTLDPLSREIGQYRSAIAQLLRASGAQETKSSAADAVETPQTVLPAERPMTTENESKESPELPSDDTVLRHLKEILDRFEGIRHDQPETVAAFKRDMIVLKNALLLDYVSLGDTTAGPEKKLRIWAKRIIEIFRNPNYSDRTYVAEYYKLQRFVRSLTPAKIRP